ncbi:MAG: sigma-70 family RNA polymerase sigma factor [Crocinitomicaceae bacterium]|nr:sigma-70 family RNA polymerase sigma factor [Crocinitomicaceae bacterium]
MKAINSLEDSQLICMYKKGDEAAFAVLLHRYKERIFRFIYSKIRDKKLSEDIFQDAFIKIIKTIKSGSYNEEGKFLPWAMRISHNLVIDYFRKTSRVKFVSESSSMREDFNIFHLISSEEQSIEEKITTSEILNQMVELVDYLPESQKRILKMRIFQEYSFKEIANIEEVSINTALGRMRYALINLRKLIKENNIQVHA